MVSIHRCVKAWYCTLVSEQGCCRTAAGRSSRLSNLRGGNSSRLLAPQGVPQGVAVADFPSGNELDAANGVVNEDAAIDITRKLVVDSLKASLQPLPIMHPNMPA